MTNEQLIVHLSHKLANVELKLSDVKITDEEEYND